ncbi:hypothetical protein CBR_g46810 [Chara braunii]|uniref:Uncharacterized protein n=1 Tax=Chara braunii TaxID=69332 RepID=A0A388M189_CHABU|nr:hypothetical protein CBR_g46810 [Chara braunii]|eukprot:GBG88243.1 hypothetical protein CBR_g46810 [Chara braunii]
MPQPPSGGQHPGGGGRGDGEDGAGPGGGGDGGDGSGSGGDETKGKGPDETSLEPKGSGGKRSVEKGSGGKGSGRKGSSGKGSDGKGPGEKGPGGKRRAFGSHESIGTESRCERSRDSDMRDEAALRSYQVLHSHLSARTLFRDDGERKVLEGPAAGVLETGPSEYERYASEGASIDFKSKSAADPGEEELSQDAHAVHREEETQHWPPRRLLDDLDAGVLETGASEHLRHPSEGVFETGASEHQCHASEGASVDVESKSAATLGEDDLSQEVHDVQRDVGSGGGESQCEGSRDSNTRDEAALGSYQVRIDSDLSAKTLFHDIEDSHRRSMQHACPVQDDTLLLHLLEEGERLQRAATSVQGPAVGVLETEASECDGHTFQETHVVQRDEELLQGSSGNAINIGDTDLVLHSGSPLMTEEGDIKGGKETVGEAQLCAAEVSARLHVGEVSARQMGSERTDHDSLSTRCGEEQGDRASALSPGREMVLHEATELVSDSATIELVSDSVVVEMQNIESSADVGPVARQDAGSPRKTPEHGVRLSMSLPIKPSQAMRGKSFSGRSLAALPKKSSSTVGLFKRVQMPRLSERAVRVLKACGIDKEEAFRKHMAASIDGVTALSDTSNDDARRGTVKDPCPKYIAKDIFSCCAIMSLGGALIQTRSIWRVSGSVMTKVKFIPENVAVTLFTVIATTTIRSFVI